MKRTALTALALTALASLPGCPPSGTPDAGSMDVGRLDTGPCDDDSDCPGSYCNLGSNACCEIADPPYEICGDRIDQNCDRRDESCGDTDGDMVPACMPGEDPLMGCDCDDERADVRPARGGTVGAPELCDARDNDCNGRIDESAECCPGCASLGDRTRADVCTEAGECDCAGEPGVGPCAEGQTCCSDGCTDVTNDFDNCGVCGARCTVSSDHCEASACACGTGLPCALDAPCTDGSCG